MKLRWTLSGVVGLALLILGFARAHAAESVLFQFRTNDVIAFVGGEDVVEMQHNGYLELLLTTALPHHNLRFRNLAFEGDTVFEQHRQLNFPSWEKQLERVGTTVVVAQFGQVESLQGTNGLGRFVEAYGKLLNRFAASSRRVVLIGPTPFGKRSGSLPDLTPRNDDLQQFSSAISRVAATRGILFVPFDMYATDFAWKTRDGMHLSSVGHWFFAELMVNPLGIEPKIRDRKFDLPVALTDPEYEPLRQLILEKNRLWFDYWRPQNWAFLNGDRTEQPSSRDHRDPKKRWFPEEMEKFLPLIEAKEKEIWEAAAKLRKGE
jgi:hypothetical protein